MLLKVLDLQDEAADGRDDAVSPSPGTSAEYADADVVGNVTLTVHATVSRVFSSLCLG